ncbi:DUF2059 domain-containing protein [Roseicella frigidaeris]|nr:DUF2059 domain-containing protein [Roseicella frigidaeris]
MPARAEEARTDGAGSAQALAAARGLVASLGLQGQVEDMIGQMRAPMIAALRQQAPRLPEAQVASLVDEFVMPEFRARAGEVVEATAAIYAGRLTPAEMRQVAEFYATLVGAKLRGLMPEVFAESMRFGQAWGARVAAAALAKHREALRARGLNL